MCKAPLRAIDAKWCSSCNHVQTDVVCSACQRPGKQKGHPCPHCQHEGLLLLYVKKSSIPLSFAIALVALISPAVEAYTKLVASPDLKCKIRTLDRSMVAADVFNMGDETGLLKDAIVAFNLEDGSRSENPAASALTEAELTHPSCQAVTRFRHHRFLETQSSLCGYIEKNSSSRCLFHYNAAPGLLTTSCEYAELFIRYYEPDEQMLRCSPAVRFRCPKQ